MLGVATVEWKEQPQMPGAIEFVVPLFERLDIQLIEEEYNHLVDTSK